MENSKFILIKRISASYKIIIRFDFSMHNVARRLGNDLKIVSANHTSLFT